MYRLLASFILLLQPMIEVSANAAIVWADNRRITFLYPGGDGLIIGVNGAAVNANAGCETDQLQILSAQGNYQVLASALMTAFAMNLPVDIAYENTPSGNCRYVVNRFLVRK